MTRLFSIKHSLAAVSAAVLLAACGGGSSVNTVPVTQDLAAVTLSPTTINEAKALASTLVGVSIPLPAGNLFEGAGSPALAPDSTLTFTAVPFGAPPEAIAGFEIKSGTDTFTGYIKAGSTFVCGTGTIGGNTYATETCLEIAGDGLVIDADTTGLTGDSTSFNITVVLKTEAGDSAPVTTTVPATIEINDDGSFVLKDEGGNTIGEGDTIEVVTGTTGGTT